MAISEKPGDLDNPLVRPTPATPYLSVVVPVYNEVESLPTLDAEIRDVLRTQPYSSEIIYVDDFSLDGSRELLLDLTSKSGHDLIETKIIFLRRNYGQTAAMAAGFEASRGVVVTPIDADGQNNPADIPHLIRVLESGYDCVSGWRHNRQDNSSRRLPSIAANWLIGRLSGVRLHDYGCTLKAYRGDLLRELRLYGDMHRFLPLYLARIGARVTELKVDHRPRVFGTSKYDSRRIFKVFLDLFLVRFMVHYSTRPLQFFGKTGLYFFGTAVGVFALMLVFKYRLLRPLGMNYQADFVETPLPALVAILMVAAVLSVFMGILAELLVRVLHEAQGAVPYAVSRRESSRVTGSLCSDPND